MPPPAPPALSVILLAPLDVARIQKTIRHLRAQMRANEIELVLVTPQRALLEETARAWREFHSVQIVAVGQITSVSRAKIQAVAASHAPFIAFAEDHAFPSPNWAEALLNAHAQRYAAVSVAMRNANPSSISRADFILNFGQWAEPVTSGVKPMLPGHNTSYTRAVLDTHGAQLDAKLDSEVVFQLELTRRGELLWLENAALLAHLNFSMWRPFFIHKFLGGRIFGARRAEQNKWRAARRMVYALSAPLIPFVRLKKMLPDLQRTNAFVPFDAKFVLALALGLATHALGEAIGYAFGIGDAREQYAPLELQRADQLRAEERELAFE